MSVAAIVLAAGGSTRMGRPKQLIQMDGEPLLRRTARMVLEVGCDPVVVVLGVDADKIEPCLSGLPVLKLINRDCWQGLSTSIRAGLDGVPPRSSGILILVCDQPGITPELLQLMLGGHHSHPRRIIACAYENTLGVPCLFPRSRFKALRGLEGDQGAKALIRAQTCVVVPFPEGEVDLDTPKDLKAWRLRHPALKHLGP